MINADKPYRWNEDTQASVRLYNEWFLDAAPKAYRDARKRTIEEVEQAFEWTVDMTVITPQLLRAHPRIIAALRMSTSPPLAKDRLIGLASGSKTLLNKMEQEGKFPLKMKAEEADAYVSRMCSVVSDLLDLGLFGWCRTGEQADPRQRALAVTVVADRLCGSIADPIVRNAQERRQLGLIEQWLIARGYVRKQHSSALHIAEMEPGTFSFRQIVVVGEEYSVKIPVDVAIQPHAPKGRRLPVLIEAKSAGDFTNTNSGGRRSPISCVNSGSGTEMKPPCSSFSVGISMRDILGTPLPKG